MRDPGNESELAQRFRNLARSSLPRAPLNSALADVIARRPHLSGLLGHAPATQQTPVLLLAAIHFLVLDEPTHPLARWYADIDPDPRPPDHPELAATLTEFVEDRAASVIGIVATRHVQTNEIGRCALLLPCFAVIAPDTGPLAHVDIGASAGLNLLLPTYAYRYDDGEPIGDPSSPVELRCGTRGAGPVDVSALMMPSVVAHRGIDTDPIDVTDPVEARWLEACCWPDQADRFRRLRAAIALARRAPPDIVRGDAVDALAATVAAATSAIDAHPVVTTTWALSYLEPDRRRAFVAELGRIGAGTDLSWVFAESPAQTPELPHADDHGDRHLTALGLVTWRNGHRRVYHLAETHPHGYWIHWR